MILQIINSKSHNPQLNLEQEEDLKKQVSPDKYVLRFWINDPALIIGRFQKEEFEAQLDYLKKHKIPLLRRSTGGGTVYHDHGTLNISFCKPREPVLQQGEKDSTMIVAWIAEALKQLGFAVTQDSRNALFIDHKKILGSAVSLTGEVLLFHCSLLVNTDLEKLEGAINWKPIYPNKSDGHVENFVKSHRSPVVNLCELNPKLTLEAIQKTIQKVITEKIEEKNQIYAKKFQLF